VIYAVAWNFVALGPIGGGNLLNTEIKLLNNDAKNSLIILNVNKKINIINKIIVLLKTLIQMKLKQKMCILKNVLKLYYIILIFHIFGRHFAFSYTYIRE